MKTEDLVVMLARNATAVDPARDARRFALVILLGVAVAFGMTASLLGLNRDLATEPAIPMFWVREIFCAVLACAGIALFLRSARPGARYDGMLPALMLPVAVLWALAAFVLLAAPSSEREALIFGQTASVCPWLIALISTPFFIALTSEMRRRAPTRLRLAGAACGGAAGALGALIYTLHCPELAAPFLAVWYLLGMLIPTLLGALAGPRLLRW